MKRAWFGVVLCVSALVHGAGAEDRMTDARTIIAAIAGSPVLEEINTVIGLEAAAPEDVGNQQDPWTTIEYPDGHELFGYDGAGGTYHVLADGRILLIDSEGSAGVVARDFETFIAMTTGLSSWRDALGFLGEKDVDAARAAWLAYDAQWGLEAQLDQPWPYSPESYLTPTPRAGRAAIIEHFGVEPLDDAFAALHEAVNTLNGDVRVLWEGEQPFLLFGRMPAPE